MKIQVGNIKSQVIQLTDEEDDLLNSILCVPIPNRQFMPSYMAGGWDGMKHFYSTQTKLFPTGFLPFVIAEANKKKFIVETEDERQVGGLPSSDTIDTRYTHLRDYQRKALKDVFNFRLISKNQVLPWQRGILKYPTGSGKTLLACALVDFIHKKTIYVIERKELMYQTYETFAKHTNMSLGLLGDGKAEFKADITFAMAQTIRSHFDNKSKLKNLDQFLKQIQCVVVDEVQHLSTGVYHKMLSKMNAPYRFGVSATPLKRGDLGDVYLIGDTGEIISEGDRKELQDKGYLAKPTVVMFKVDQPYSWDMSYKHAYQNLIVENEYRNEIICNAVLELRKRGCTVLILVHHIAHGNVLHRLLRKSKVKSIFVQGADSMEDRQLAKDEIGKSFHVLIATGIFDEGVDMPLIDAGIMAGGGQKDSRVIQRVGRIIRPKPGTSNEVYVLDFVDSTNKYLLRHSAAREDAYKNEGFKMKYPKGVDDTKKA